MQHSPAHTVKIDMHIHLAGTGCCDSGCWISDDFKRRHTFLILKWLHRITSEQMKKSIDLDWVERISTLIRTSGVDYGVVLGFDGVYDTHSGSRDQKKSQMIIPPEWVFKVCRQFPNLLPGPSINPYRQDALELLDYCIKERAVLIKWLPPAQGIDPGTPQIRPFYEKLAESGIPLLVHMGRERTFATVTNDFNHVSRLELPLSMGVKVICAHTATRVLGVGSKEEDQIADLKSLLQRYEHCYVDNSGLCNPSRFAHLPVLGRDELIKSRTLYGSDWPVPANAFYYLGNLGWGEVRRLERIKNVIDRDIAIKLKHGYDERMFLLTHKVLANLDAWIIPRSQPE